ncbi:MAG: biotin-dependent carboxyltransferase family protein [Xanthomonadales bacterium]|nr:biotin-dependent carboxyltransferase family protein [Xanthomonadales bacterium]
MSITVLKPGLMTSLQDRGRRGHMAIGVGRAGPMDELAHRLANALVGNDPGAVALEVSLLGPRLRFEADACIALAGAPFPARLGGAVLPMWQARTVAAGEVLDVGALRSGARACLAVAGGFAVDAVLGSRACDVNARLGPFGGRPLIAGDVLPLAAAPRRGDANWSLDPRPWFDPDPERPLRLVRGTHFERLDAASQVALFEAGFRIAADSNRVGFRLDGPRLSLSTPLETVSEPVAFGTVQLPPGGQPIVLMAEHPTTGGYPRIGQVAAVDLPRLAQRPPGAPVRFRPIGHDEAEARYLERERALARLIDRIARRRAG